MALTNSNTHKFQSGELVTADKLNNTQIIQGDNTTVNDAFTGTAGQITYDNQAKKLRVHDGTTAGGFVIQRSTDASNISTGDIGTTELADDAVTSIKIADGAVTASKLAETYSLSTHTHADATTTDPGFLSASDKNKLDGIQAGATSGGGTFEKICDGYFSVNAVHSFNIDTDRNVLLTMGFRGGQGGLTSVYGEFQYNMGPSNMQMGAVGTGHIFANGGVDFQVYFSPTNQFFITGSSTTQKLHFRCNETRLSGSYGVPSGENFWATAFYIS